MVEKEQKISARLKQIIDDVASSTEYVTYKDILSIYLGRPIEKNESPSSLPESKTLKMVISRAGAIFDYKNGKDAKEGFRYKREFTHFFEKYNEEKQLKKKEGEEKKHFVTAGLQMLFDDKTISEPLIDFECINDLTNIQLVKILYPFLGKTVISFNYNRGYKDTVNILIHPHLLKEYNSRWFLFGFTKDEFNNLRIGNFSIDRIVFMDRKDIRVHSEIKFIKAPVQFYNNYFQDIVGVTKNEGDKPIVITIRTTEYKVHKLIKTKPIHHSQKETRSFVDDNEGREMEGEFTIEVVPNIELQTKLLSYGSGIYVIGNGEFQQKLKNTIAKMAKHYFNEGNKK